MAFSSQPTLIPAYQVLVKPTGALCNLDCKYCFYLTKSELYPGSDFRMPDEVLETFIRQLCESQPGPQVSLAFQGGEPTLMGLDYFRRAVQLAERLKRPGQGVEYSLQTNGVLLDDEWGQFLSEQRFLVGLSLDGPSELHDVYRVDQGGAPSFQRALAGLRVLQKYQVEYNLLCSVHATNSDHGLRIYRYFRDELGAQYLQFIPIVERAHQNDSREGEWITERSVRPEQWGDFLVQVFDEWVRRDVGKVFVTIFESALANWLGLPAGTCIFNATCGKALALEHTGDLYACDHFVEPDYLLGNIREESMAGLVASQQQRDFGRAKRDSLPKYCRECPVRFACHGECPKNRFTPTPDGEPSLNYLCAGYRRFFQHIDGPMRFMVEELHQQRSPQGVMRHMKRKR